MQGLVFGVGTDKGVLKLFDVRSYAQGPFDAFTVSHQPVIRLHTVTKALMHNVVHVHSISMMFENCSVLLSASSWICAACCAVDNNELLRRDPAIAYSARPCPDSLHKLTYGMRYLATQQELSLF